MEPEALLGEFRDAYHREVEQVVHDLLLGDRPRWTSVGDLMAPLEMTMAGRRNFFRTGFALAAGDAVGRSAVGRLAAAAAEIGWTCALMLDDILDGSVEREGHPCAHRVYGSRRTLASAFAGVAIAATRAPIALPAPGWPRAQMELLGLTLLARGALVQAPALAHPRTMRRYRLAAREMNNSTHWAIVAPLSPYAPRGVSRAGWAYADVLAVMGKISNDLADYCGGSSESVIVHKDFHGRTPTFPILQLLEAPLAPRTRARVERHFFERSRATTLTLEELLEQLESHAVIDRCYATLRSQQVEAFRLADMLLERAPRATELAALMRRWADYVIVRTSERLTLRPCSDAAPAPLAMTVAAC